MTTLACNKCSLIAQNDAEIAAHFTRSTRSPYGMNKRCNTCRAKDDQRYGKLPVKPRAKTVIGSGVIAPRPYARGAKWGAGWLELGG